MMGRTIMPAPQDAPVAGQQQKIRQVWTPEEDQLLSEAVARETPKHGPVSWHKVASHLPGRNNKDCRKRWHYSIANSIRKGTWMREEDEKLREAVELYGARWSKIAEAVGTRNGDQCWKRWYDCLDPRIDKSPWTAEEDARLLHLVSHTGRNWSDIVHQHFPNRTSLAAKNRYSILRRKHDRPGQHPSPQHLSPQLSPPTTTTATSTPSLTSSPFLGLPTTGTPSSTACTTPEPEFSSPPLAAGVAEDWMAMTEAEMDELLYYQSGAHLAVPTTSAAAASGSGGLVVAEAAWYPTAVATTSAATSVAGWTSTVAAMDGGWYDSSPALMAPAGMQTAAAAAGYAGGGAAEYYAAAAAAGQQQQQQLESGGGGYGYENMLGVYQAVEPQQQGGGYEAGGAGMHHQQGMGGWQAGYGGTTGGW